MEIIKNISKKCSTPLAVGVLLSISISTVSFVVGAMIFGLPANLNVEKLSILSIFLHNSILTVVLLLSVYTYGILSGCLLGLNFFIFGLKTRALLMTFDWEMLVKKVVLHGFFEVPSILLAAGFGFYWRSQKLLKQERSSSKELLQKALPVLFICLVLNLISAIIESKVGMR